MSFFNRKNFIGALFIAAFLVTTCATRGTVYSGLDPKAEVPVMENLRQGTLPNGLRYYIYENRKPENRAMLTLAVNAGAILEEDDENGLAHFVEHMAFNGTERFSESEVVDYLRSLGMRFGADVNAYTTADETVYGIEVPVETDALGKKYIPERALQIIDDWTHAITFAPEEIEKERKVVMEEYRMRRLGAQGRQQKALWTVLLSGSLYAERDVIGLPEIIENATPEKIKGFYQKWYRPENMAIIFVGDFDGESLEKSLASHFDAPANTEPFVLPEYSLPPPKKGNIQVELLSDQELSYTMFYFFYKRPYQKTENTIASYRQTLIENLIDRMIEERYNDMSLEPDSPFVGAGAYFYGMVRPSSFYTMILISKEGMAEQTLDSQLRIKESVRRYGFTATEIERAKNALLSELNNKAAEKEKSESFIFIDGLTSHYLKNEMLPGIDWELEHAKKLLPAISKRDIHRTAKNYFSDDDVLVFVSAPETETIPSKDSIIKKIKSSGSLKIKKPEEAVFDSTLLSEMPERGEIINKSVDEDNGLAEWELGNGARIILKQTENQNDEIELYAASRTGEVSVPLEDAVSAELAAELLEASGLGHWPRQELVKKLSDKQIDLSFNTGPFTSNISGYADSASLKTLFELLYLTFTESRIDPKMMPVVLDEYRTLLAQRSENPDNVFADEIKKTTYGSNPRFMPLTVDDLSKVNIDRAQTFIESCLNPADYTFVISGNIDLEIAEDLVETYIASIPLKEEAAEQWARPDPPIQRPGKTDAVIRKGKDERASVYSGRFVSKTFDESTAMVCNALTEYLNIVLVESIREKLGGAYSISASVSSSPIPPDGEITFEVRFGCDPKRSEELISAVEAELRKIADGTINADTFGKAQKALIKNWEQSMQSNAYLSRSFANNRVVFDIPLAHLFDRPRFYEAVRMIDMQELMKVILQEDAVSVFLYPAGE